MSVTSSVGLQRAVSQKRQERLMRSVMRVAVTGEKFCFHTSSENGMLQCPFLSLNIFLCLTNIH